MELAQVKVQSYELPTVIKHGAGALAVLGDEATRLGIRRPLVVTDPGMVKAGHVDRAAALLRGHGLDPGIFDGVAGNPSIHHVARGTEAYRDHRADGMVALGGGSSMDTAKAIGVEVAHGGKVLDYEYGHTPLSRRTPRSSACRRRPGPGARSRSGRSSPTRPARSSSTWAAR